MKSFHRLFAVVTLSLAFTAAGCTSSDNLSSKGQLIECAVAADGTTSDCTPVDQPSNAPGTCVDIDTDGDDDPDDADEVEDEHASVTGDTDDDDDGISDADDDDDDNDGVDDGRDCDELPGHDDDDSDDPA